MSVGENQIGGLQVPLLGDGNGQYRINVVGNSGAGKSTMAGKLSRLLNLPVMYLDEVFWQPGWVLSDGSKIQNRVIEFMAHSEKTVGGWVIDGNWTQKLGSTVQDAATDVIWLDPPLLLYFPRLLLRTFGRLLGFTPQCAPGCDENLKEVFFSQDSIIWYCLSNHWKTRRKQQGLFDLALEQDGASKPVSFVKGDLTRAGRRLRIGGWGTAYGIWWDAVERLVEKQRRE